VVAARGRPGGHAGVAVRVAYPVALVVAAVVVEETHFVALPRLEPNVVLFVFCRHCYSTRPSVWT